MFYPTLDLFNLMDLIAIRDDRSGVMGVQVCGEDIAPHIHKIMEGYTVEKIKKNKETMQSEVHVYTIPPNPYIKTWLTAGNTFFIWGWRLRKNEGKKASYQLRQIEFIVENGVVVHREVSRD